MDGSRWIAIDRDGVSHSDVKAAYFGTAIDAVAYAHSAGFEVEGG
jgi:hypothetical protein